MSVTVEADSTFAGGSKVGFEIDLTDRITTQYCPKVNYTIVAYDDRGNSLNLDFGSNQYA